MTSVADVINAITNHHVELQSAVSAKVENVIAAARVGTPHVVAVAELNALLAADIVPHARAEEDVLYAAATSANLRSLVAGMTFEHETLLSLAAELATSPTAVDAAGAARAIREIFVGHVRRENELLLPALAADSSVDLVALLPVMEKRFDEYRNPSRPLPMAGVALSADGVLDIRNEAPARRHELIFQTFAETPIGGAFILVNDHDPKPLYYQFEAEEAGKFAWEYLESGPKVWRVSIGHTAP